MTEARPERFAFYPGCLVLERMPQYELATKRVLAQLGIELVDMQQAACCGAPVVESFSDQWLVLAAYNLALAEQMELDILTVCGSCTNSLRRARLALLDPDTRESTNRKLAKLGLRTNGQSEITHLLQVLSERRDRMAQKMTHPLSLRAALTYPCQVVRPSEIAQFDDPLQPRSMHELVALTGAEIVETGVEHECCGSSYLMDNQEIALEAGRRKLQASRHADVLVDACGNCHLLLDRMQKSVCSGQTQTRLPVLFLPQLLGLAMGLAAEDLALPASWQKVGAS